MERLTERNPAWIDSKHCLAGIGECDCSKYETCTNCNVEVRKWLQSEAE